MVFLNASAALLTLRVLVRCRSGTYVRPERDRNSTAILGPDMAMLKDMQGHLPPMKFVYKGNPCTRSCLRSECGEYSLYFNCKFSTGSCYTIPL